MGIRGCPAAVSENEVHDTHWSLGTGKRWTVGSRPKPERSQARRPASTRRRETSGGGSTWKPRGRRAGPVTRALLVSRVLGSSRLLARRPSTPEGASRREPMERDADGDAEPRREREANGTEAYPQTTMRVRKRNGSAEPVDVNKIVRAVSRCCVGPDRRRRAARRDQDDQRPLRRRHDPRARPALDPDRGGADRRGAAVRAARRAPARRPTSTRKCATRRSTPSRSRSPPAQRLGLINDRLGELRRAATRAS